MREEEIRPAELMAKKKDALVRDVRFLLDRQDRFVRVACPACDSNNLKHEFAKDGFSYEKCLNCETLLMNPRASEELMQEFYAKSENYDFWNRYIFPATEEARRANIFRPRAKLLHQICSKRGIDGGVSLEIGAGFGTFCEELCRLKMFDRVIALEPTPGLADTCEIKGLETIRTPVERCHLANNSVDVITCFEVVEHLFSPATFVKTVQRLLKPSGLLIMSCPNLNGFDVATLGAISATIDHEHVNYFHPQSISLLLQRMGMSIVDIQTPGQLDAELVRKAVLTQQYDLAGQSLLRRILLDEWDRLGGPFQEFLVANQLSSHMWIVAVKSQSQISS